MFGGSKKTYVSSTVYNLAGDMYKRPDHLQGVVVSNLLFSDGKDISDALIDSYLFGSGTNLNRFFRWCLENYTTLGLPKSQISSTMNIDSDIVKEELPQIEGSIITIERIDSGDADYGYWAERYMLVNYPLLYETDWTSDYIESTHEIKITFEDLTIELFTPSGFIRSRRYLYVYYRYNNENLKLYIYRFGSGNLVLDALEISPEDQPGEFFPYLPIRRDNWFITDITDSVWEPILEEVSKAYYVASGGSKLTKLIKDMENTVTGNLSEIDYAYVVFGVSLNEVNDISKKYLYNFLLELKNSTLSPGGIDTWKIEMEEYLYKVQLKAEWENAQLDTEDPLYGTPAPIIPKYPVADLNFIELTSINDEVTGYSVKIEWNSIREITGTGRAWTGAKKNDLKFSTEVNNDLPFSEYPGKETVRLFWQVTKNEWKCLEIVGLKYLNHIWNGHWVGISAKEAIEDTDESGFIIPLHYETWKKFSMKDRTQIGDGCMYIQLNSYKVVKKKWYEGLVGFFIGAVVSVVSFGILSVVGLVAGGILGANAALGGALGLSGAAAVAAGAAINAIAGVVISSLVTMGATEILGDTIGPIVGAILSIIAMNMTASFSSSGSFFTNFSDLVNVDNIFKIMDAAGKGYKNYVADETKKIANKITDLLNDYAKDSKELKDQYYEEFGAGVNIDPMEMIDNKVVTESLSSFLARTLLSSSDIIDITLSTVNEYSKINLTLNNEIY